MKTEAKKKKLEINYVRSSIRSADGQQVYSGSRVLASANNAAGVVQTVKYDTEVGFTIMNRMPYHFKITQVVCQPRWYEIFWGTLRLAYFNLFGK